MAWFLLKHPPLPLSDRIGRRASMLWFGALGTLCTLPILMTLKTVGSPVLAGLLIIMGMAIISFYTSIGGIVKAEMFPPEVRALGVGLSYAIANAMFGGTAEYVALGLKSLGHEEAFYWYVSGIPASFPLPFPDCRVGGFLPTD
ncbi:hypothetical protein GCM10027514_34200 [Azotobacter armeniacus]